MTQIALVNANDAAAAAEGWIARGRAWLKAKRDQFKAGLWSKVEPVAADAKRGLESGTAIAAIIFVGLAAGLGGGVAGMQLEKLLLKQVIVSPDFLDKAAANEKKLKANEAEIARLKDYHSTQTVKLTDAIEANRQTSAYNDLVNAARIKTLELQLAEKAPVVVKRCRPATSAWDKFVASMLPAGAAP